MSTRPSLNSLRREHVASAAELHIAQAICRTGRSAGRSIGLLTWRRLTQRRMSIAVATTTSGPSAASCPGARGANGQSGQQDRSSRDPRCDHLRAAGMQLALRGGLSTALRRPAPNPMSWSREPKRMCATPFTRSTTIIAAVQFLERHSQARFNQMVLRLELENEISWDTSLSFAKKMRRTCRIVVGRPDDIASRVPASSYGREGGSRCGAR
jgi:hypothetical protein